MILSVLRNADGYDCTNGGLSSKHADIFVRLPNCDTDKSEPHGAPVFRLEQHTRGCLRLVPENETRWCMFGGNFAHTSDSRFNEAVAQLLGHRFYGAIAIHDRIEG